MLRLPVLAYKQAQDHLTRVAVVKAVEDARR
jgi:hypothetical protein